MKRVIAVLMVVATFGMAFAQEGSTSLTDPDPTIIGADSAKQALREVSVDLYEREGSWNARISSDNGVVTARLFDGSPAAKEPLAENEGVTDERVLGVKVEFFRRGINSFYVTAARPIPVEGITKTVSVWVTGRNQGHELYLLVQDYFGNNFEIYMGTLAFSGWKKMTAAIPPSPDGERGIVQQSAYYGERPGLRIIGFRVDCDPLLARGSYYLYFDDLRAVTDLYDMENRNEDDMVDNW
jgi:hypothetical protein